jgi:hypothetical protein
VKSVI